MLLPNSIPFSLPALALIISLGMMAQPTSLPAQSLRPDEAAKPSVPVGVPPLGGPGFTLVHHPGMINRFQANAEEIVNALNKGMLAWSGADSVSAAWSGLVGPGDRVGIRINTSGGAITATHPDLIDAIVSGLCQAGVPPENIIVFDKYPHHMHAAGYVPMQPKSDWQCLSIVEGAGWDPEVFYFHENVGRLIWGDHEFKGKGLPVVPGPALAPEKAPDDSSATVEQISNRSYFNTIVTRRVDKIINVPAMTSHSGVGVLGCLSSLALGTVDNHRRFLDGSKASATAIAEILQKEELAGKVILHIMDGLIMQYAGGPAFDPNHADSTGFLLIGQDPVAIDSWVLRQMEFRREDKKVVPIGDKALHIEAARAFGLGRHFEDAEITRIDIPPGR